MLIRTTAHQNPPASSTLVPVLDVGREAVTCYVTKVKGAICVWPRHEYSDVRHALARRSVKLDIYVMFARGGLEPNAVESPTIPFSRVKNTPRGIIIG